MPLYQYLCYEHGVFDEFNTVKDRSFRLCPQCQKLCPMVIAPSNFQLKGEGWAKDGYAKKEVK